MLRQSSVWENSPISRQPTINVQTAIVGSGFIGRAWAISFARAGAQVRLWDHVEGEAEKAASYIAAVLDDLAHYDLLNGQTPAQLIALIEPVKHCETY